MVQRVVNQNPMESPSPLADKPALPELLVDLTKLESDYFDKRPNSFGGNRKRGSTNRTKYFKGALARSVILTGQTQ